MRLATDDDVDAMVANVAAGFETYRAWAPRGWEPPTRENLLERMAFRRLQPGWRAHVNEDVTAHVASAQMREEPGVLHLIQLFLRPHLHGSGIAKTLHDLAMQDGRDQGLGSAYLDTPAGNARGIAFYTREGWTQDGPTVLDPLAGLDVITLRRPL